MNDRLEIASRFLSAAITNPGAEPKTDEDFQLLIAGALGFADTLIAREAATRPAEAPKPNLVFLTPEDAEIIRNAKPDSLFQLRIAGNVVQKVEVAE